MQNASSEQPKRLNSGISGLNEVLHGGLIAHRFYLVEGSPGAGKTTLALQYLIEGARNGGVGTRLIRELQERASASGRTLALNVIRGNRAKALYERLGFSIVGGDEEKIQMRWQTESPNGVGEDRSRQLWSEVKGSGISKWIYVGSGVYARRQGGYTFAFDAPGGGKTFVLRGAVDYKWTKGRRIVRTARVITKSGHPGTKGADPTTYSASLC